MTSPVTYQRKRALIIGINDYQRDPLQYCINDATDLSKTLRRIGFDISLGIDSDMKEFYRQIDTFVKETKRDDLVLFYFAGHGSQMEGHNYLLPSDYHFDHRGLERDYIPDHAINVQYITDKIDATKCRITIYLLDCCRHIIRSRATNANQGLLPMHVPSQTLIIYACAPGKAVQDETRNSRNGSFIENLLKYIDMPNKDIEEIMKTVAADVNVQTDGFQLPYRTSSLTGTVYLVANQDREDSRSTASPNSDVYSDENIRCRGRACAKCSRCRDWYWPRASNKMRHTKRSDAVCILMNLSYYDNDRNYYDGDFHTVCQCDDNRV